MRVEVNAEGGAGGQRKTSRLIRRADITPFIPFAAQHPIMKFNGLVKQWGAPNGPELFQALPRVELLDLDRDPEEQVNLAAGAANVAGPAAAELRRLDALLDPWRHSPVIAL